MQILLFPQNEKLFQRIPLLVKWRKPQESSKVTALSQNDPKWCFKAWKACMMLHVAHDGKYFDVKNMKTQ
jgi:hypothetical protein